MTVAFYDRRDDTFKVNDYFLKDKTEVCKSQSSAHRESESKRKRGKIIPFIRLYI